MLTKEDADGSKNKAMATDPKTKVRYQVVGHLSDLTDYFLTMRFAAAYGAYKRGGRMHNITVGGMARNHHWEPKEGPRVIGGSTASKWHY